jgi:outer membrane protein assembly factor BamB
MPKQVLRLKDKQMNSKPWLWLLIGTLALGGCSWLPSWMGGTKKAVEKLEGDRIAVMPASVAMQADPEIARVQYRAPEPQQNNEWRQHSGNFAPVAANLYASGNFSIGSSATAGDGNAFVSKLVVSPVVGGGLVYVMDGSGYITAHDMEQISKIQWKSEGVYEDDAPDGFGGGLAYDNGILYAVSGRGHIVAIDAQTGQMIWHKALSLPFRSPPRVSDGRLFATTLDNQLYALQAATGDVLWTHRGISETTDILHTVSPAINNEMLIVPYSSGELYALTAAAGQEIWRDSVVTGGGLRSTVSFTGIGGDPIVDGDVVFTVATGGKFSVLHAGAGQRIWERPFGAINTPWVAGDYAYLLTGDNAVISFVKYNGKIRWATQLASYTDPEDKEGLILWKGPVMVNGTLLLVGSHGGMVRLDAGDGTILGTQELAYDIYTAPVVAGGRMYLVSQDATLYAFE